MRPFNKIFGVGLSRTGTSSLNQAFIELGLKAVHFPETPGAIDAHDAASDTPIADKFVELDAAYPGSLFILTVRPVEDWLSSVERFWAAFGQFTFSPEIMVLHRRLYGAALFDRPLYAAAYARHVKHVREYFRDRPRDLLEMNVCAGEGWGPLCAFLEVPVPPTDFPKIYPIGSKPAD